MSRATITFPARFGRAKYSGVPDENIVIMNRRGRGSLIRNQKGRFKHKFKKINTDSPATSIFISLKSESSRSCAEFMPNKRKGISILMFKSIRQPTEESLFCTSTWMCELAFSFTTGLIILARSAFTAKNVTSPWTSLPTVGNAHFFDFAAAGVNLDVPQG